MKKILIVAFLSVGFFSMVNAQTLNYRLDNQSSDPWSFTIDHAGTAPSAVVPVPPGTTTGTIGSSTSTFALPIEMTAANLNNGCYGSAITDNPGSASIPIVCPQTSNVSYRLIENIQFVLYTLQVRFN